MSVYPVAYRAAALALQQGFQMPKVPNAPLPVLAFLAAFLATWKALNYFDPEGAKQIEDYFEKLEEEKPWEGMASPAEQGLVPAKIAPWRVVFDCGASPPCTGGFCNPIPSSFTTVFGTCNICYPVQPGYTPKMSDTNVYQMMVCPTAPTSHWAPWRRLWNDHPVAGNNSPAYPNGRTMPLDVSPVGADAGDIARPKERPLGYPNAWSLPVRGYGEVVNPPYPVPGRTLPGSVAPGVGALPGVGTGTGAGVGTGVGVGAGEIVLPLPIVVSIGTTVSTVPAQPLGQNHFPPSKGKAEVKMRGKAASGIRWLANFLTESKDFIEALWKALPKEMRSKCKGPRGGKAKCTVQQMLADLYKARAYISNNEEYVKRAVIEVIINEVGDTFYGWAGQKYKAAGEVLRNTGYWENRPAGWQTGNRYIPRPKTPGEHHNYVEEWVTNAVNAIW